ncbi:hypothetical protein Vadar_028276 [Vaccinium darrowii]|uniref:Uncharacterized protein n=1 Tax=Vaccinium darrowii TaxID=229202 RepID=A0ACB7XUM9_9ERIC|nr:hypothetical protein Vadar_028276 [Vaccinium darrowii]
MDSMKILICRHGSDVLVVRLVGGIKLFDVFRKICDRWDTLCIGRFSLSYVLEGCNCKLVDEEDFDNMLYLCPDSNRIYGTVEEVRPSIALSGGSTMAVTVGATGVLEDMDMEEPLEEFCRHSETRVTAKCKFGKCEWRVHAILDRSSGEFVIKDLLNEHRCGSTYRRNKHKRVTSSLVASEIASMVNQNNNTSPMHILEFFADKYGLDLPYYHAWLGVEKARGKGFRNKLVKLFNKIAYAPSVASYNVCVTKFCDHGGAKAKTFLASVPKEHWTNAYFKGKRYGEMSSSAIESFNNWVLEARRMPVMNLVDCLRSKIMVQMSKRREDSATWISEIGPVMDAKLKKRIEKGRAWRVQKSSTGVYEVKSMPAVVVDLEEGTCSCGSWQYNGFVCAHVATVLAKTCGEEESMADYIDPFYHVVAYQQTYEDKIHPVLAMDIPDFTQGTSLEIKPPRNRRPPGRPCLKRIRSRGEECTARPRKCSRCHQLCNHNRRTCTEASKD